MPDRELCICCTYAERKMIVPAGMRITSFAACFQHSLKVLRSTLQCLMKSRILSGNGVTAAEILLLS